MLGAGTADYLALGANRCRRRSPELPGSHIVDGRNFSDRRRDHGAEGHPEHCAYVTKFIEDAKASGSVRRAMDRAGMANLAVAPPER